MSFSSSACLRAAAVASPLDVMLEPDCGRAALVVGAGVQRRL